jgi:hypothetical protein
MFSQVDISLNGTLITSSTNTYAYRAYIETLLSYGLEAKSSQLTSALFYKDDAGKMDRSNPLAADAAQRNTGLATRQTFSAESKEIDMIGRIHADIFFQERYMLNEINTKIKLIRSPDSFCLMATGAQQFKVVVTKATLLVRKVKISPFGVPGSCQNSRKRNSKISNQTSDLQDVHNTNRILGYE